MSYVRRVDKWGWWILRWGVKWGGGMGCVKLRLRPAIGISVDWAGLKG